MKKIIFLVLIFVVGCSDQTNTEQETVTLEEFQKAQDETYNLGYADGYDAALQEQPAQQTQPSVILPSSGLTLFSDGFDWNVSTQFDKKDFMRSLSKTNGIFISEVDSYVNALDVFYADVGNHLKTIEQAIQEIEGS